MNPRLLELHDHASALARQAVQTWGADAQVRMVLEEIAELQVALLHWSRRRANWRDVLEELVDVEVTLHGLRHVLAKGELEVLEGAEAAVLQTQLARLKDRLASGKGHEGAEGG